MTFANYTVLRVRTSSWTRLSSVSRVLWYTSIRSASELTLSSYSDAVDPVFVSQNRDRIVTFRKTLSNVLHKLGETDGKGRRLLDIGCAGGAFPVAARDLGFDPVGVEPSRWLADYGRRTYGLDIRNGILQEGMFPGDSFDVVTLWDVIEHVPDPHQLLTLVNSLLKPGGLLLVNYPDVGSIAARLLDPVGPSGSVFTCCTTLVVLWRGSFSRLAFRFNGNKPARPRLRSAMYCRERHLILNPLDGSFPLLALLE